MRFVGFWPKRFLLAGCAVLVATIFSYSQTTSPQSTPSASDASPAVQTPASKSAAATHSASSKPHSATSKSGEKTSASVHNTTKGKKKSQKTASWRKGQQKIDHQRALEIQQALIREHYMDGEPSGVWDDATQKAMQRFQADNSWQSKSTPDARALIKLGLGPDHEHLLNPESAMIAAPAASTPASAPEPNGGSAGKIQPQKNR